MKNLHEQGEILQRAQEYQSFEIGRTGRKKEVPTEQIEQIKDITSPQTEEDSNSGSGLIFLFLFAIAVGIYYYLTK